MSIRPKKKKKRTEDKICPFKGVTDKTYIEALELAEQVATTERAIKLLKQDNKKPREKLFELMSTFNIPYVNIEIKTKDESEPYYASVVTKRGAVPTEKGIKKMLSIYLKKLLGTEHDYKKIAGILAKKLSGYLRADAIMVTKIGDKKWGKDLLEQKEIEPYVMIAPGKKS